MSNISIYAAINAMDEFVFIEVIGNCLPFIHSNISFKTQKEAKQPLYHVNGEVRILRRHRVIEVPKGFLVDLCHQYMMTKEIPFSARHPLY